MIDGTPEDMEKLDAAMALLARYEAAFGPGGWLARNWDHELDSGDPAESDGWIICDAHGTVVASGTTPLEAVEAAMAEEA